jgi:hypothetical protein
MKLPIDTTGLPKGPTRSDAGLSRALRDDRGVCADGGGGITFSCTALFVTLLVALVSAGVESPSVRSCRFRWLAGRSRALRPARPPCSAFFSPGFGRVDALSLAPGLDLGDTGAAPDAVAGVATGEATGAGAASGATTGAGAGLGVLLTDFASGFGAGGVDVGEGTKSLVFLTVGERVGETTGADTGSGA